MGEVELDSLRHQLSIRSVFYFYGDASTKILSEQVAADIARYWNEPAGRVFIRREWYDVRFNIEGHWEPGLAPETVWYNNDPASNFFRIEAFSASDISFVDGLKSNTGYFKLGNLINNSTTAAHEYGHTLGLEHPAVLDIRGKGQPGIMYPRGTICDPEFQYDPTALPLQPGGTLNPFTRKVLQSDVDDLMLPRLSFNRKGISVIGDFSAVYHQKHEPPV
ncbi:MAG TPA: hypothetical protein VMI35_12820 [Puia sp.]|nr:hypothetical protein [Puia sp.]